MASTTVSGRPVVRGKFLRIAPYILVWATATAVMFYMYGLGVWKWSGAIALALLFIAGYRYVSGKASREAHHTDKSRKPMPLESWAAQSGVDISEPMSRKSEMEKWFIIGVKATIAVAVLLGLNTAMNMGVFVTIIASVLLVGGLMLWFGRGWIRAKRIPVALLVLLILAAGGTLGLAGWYVMESPGLVSNNPLTRLTLFGGGSGYQAEPRQNTPVTLDPENLGLSELVAIGQDWSQNVARLNEDLALLQISGKNVYKVDDFLTGGGEDMLGLEKGCGYLSDWYTEGVWVIGEGGEKELVLGSFDERLLKYITDPLVTQPMTQISAGLYKVGLAECELVRALVWPDDNTPPNWDEAQKREDALNEAAAKLNVTNVTYYGQDSMIPVIPEVRIVATLKELAPKTIEVKATAVPAPAANYESQLDKLIAEAEENAVADEQEPTPEPEAPAEDLTWMEPQDAVNVYGILTIKKKWCEGSANTSDMIFRPINAPDVDIHVDLSDHSLGDLQEGCLDVKLQKPDISTLGWHAYRSEDNSFALVGYGEMTEPPAQADNSGGSGAPTGGTNTQLEPESHTASSLPGYLSGKGYTMAIAEGPCDGSGQPVGGSTILTKTYDYQGNFREMVKVDWSGIWGNLATKAQCERGGFAIQYTPSYPPQMILVGSKFETYLGGYLSPVKGLGTPVGQDDPTANCSELRWSDFEAYQNVRAALHSYGGAVWLSKGNGLYVSQSTPSECRMIPGVPSPDLDIMVESGGATYAFVEAGD
ncbi:MAG: hypothetical protein UU77_C0026G0003 [candidate division WWE3 bacterium GW2011_GWC1_41_7]|uniref:Uncharacterized protein n=1 Tax=candidate division WWE3 bacterium GW2011_GWC1_41_7 TaxID=1619119 RepID=A0A0G0X6A4_UNCKA|nr:MAG: hypothetical protein UU77_C0026G0003 [candidate division WWE3 bacterium GW2011_GWC1_41_7]